MTDVKALQKSMYHSMAVLLPSIRTRGTMMLERAGRGQLRSNLDVDYAELYENGNLFYKDAVETLYKEAGISLKRDLKKINAAPRIKPDPVAVKYWSAPGRTHLGKPKVPLLRIHTSGDGLVYPTMVQGYETLVKRQGFSEMYRSAYVNNWGHCMLSTPEWLAAVETVVERIKTGIWPDTDPKSMNRRAKKLDSRGKARYFDYYGVEKYNRIWTSSIQNYQGSKGLN